MATPTSSVRRSFRTLKFLLGIVLVALSVGAATFAQDTRKPTVFLIGDSTVKNGTAGQVGWGSLLQGQFDAAAVRVENRALGGRSSRTYLREGLWEKVLTDIHAGDFVIMQFGHNDNGPIDTGKARASLKGNSDEVRQVTLQETGAVETVHSYGWYLRRYISDAQGKGATPIVCSLVPRNIWVEGKVVRAGDSFTRWAREAAEQGGASFIDLNDIVAQRYEALGQERVQALFTSADHTHTSPAGAALNAECVADGLRSLQRCTLAQYLRAPDKAAPGSR